MRVLVALVLVCSVGCQRLPDKQEYKRCVQKDHWEKGCRLGLVTVK